MPSPKSAQGQYLPLSPSPPCCLTCSHSRAHGRGPEGYLRNKQKPEVQVTMDVGTQMPFVFPGNSGHIINLASLLNSVVEEAVSSPKMAPPSPGSLAVDPLSALWWSLPSLPVSTQTRPISSLVPMNAHPAACP